MDDIQQRVRKALWFPETAGVSLIHDNLYNFKKCQSDQHCANGTEEIRTFYNQKEHPQDVGRAGDISQERCWTARLLEYKCINKTKPANSDPCLGKNTKHSLSFYTLWDPCFGISRSLEQITKEPNEHRFIKPINLIVEGHFGDIYLKSNTVTWKDGAKAYRHVSPIIHELATKILRSIVSFNNIHIEQLTSNNTVPAAEDCEMQLHRQSSFPTLRVLFGPYAQTHVVYNVTEQAKKPMKEQGTSQQFKQRSLGIGSSSISGNDSSSTPPKRRAIRIESGVSFSIEFTDRGKSSGSETSTLTPASLPSVADTKSKKGKGKKELHRCLCTLSFPTDDKKLKNKPCDSGVCVPGNCTPIECYKRLQEKYGSKKKSASVSSSQASQTGKKLKRAGKETVVKETGSSSISKYQESTEVKPVPEKPKFDIIKTTKDCCDKYCKTVLDKIQFWKKDKGIALKPAGVGTDISVKGSKDKSFGASAATQSRKIKGKADKGAAGDKKGTKKGKKEKKEEKKVKALEKKADKKAKKDKKEKKEEKKEKKEEKKEKRREKKARKKEMKEKKAEKKSKTKKRTAYSVSAMSGLMAEKHKHNPTKKILEEACALIELSNLVESYKREQTKRHKRGICDGKVDSSKIPQRDIDEILGSIIKDGVTKLKLDDRRRPSPRHVANDIAALSLRNLIDSKTCTPSLKRIARHELKKMHCMKDMNGETNKSTGKKHRSTAIRKTGTKLTDRQIVKQVLASDFDLVSLYDQIKHDNLCKSPIIKSTISKCSFKLRENSDSLSEALKLNQDSIKRDNFKQDKDLRIAKTEQRKSEVKKSSVHLCLNLRVKPDSNTLNLQIKSRRVPCKTEKSDLNTLSLRLPLQCAATDNQKKINEKVLHKVLANLSTTCVEKSAPSSLGQTLNDPKLHTPKQQVSSAPYAKTQAVYNLYDMALMQRPREVKGMKSHLYFNFNIGRNNKLPTAQRDTPSDGMSEINTQPSFRSGSQVFYKSKVNMNKGLTSLQQSFVLDRTGGNRQVQQSQNNDSESDYPQSCRCTPNLYSDTQQSESVCSPCYQDAGNTQTPLPDNLIDRYALLYYRTKNRILDRVGLSAEEARSMIFSPGVFMKKLQTKCRNIANRVEAQQKSVGSCTCSPFIETEEVCVQEENASPECSLFKKWFGQLIYSDKCVACNKRVGSNYHLLEPDVCEPGECVEKGPGLFSCFKEWCKRKEKPIDKKKAKEKEKLKKAKARAKALAQAKKNRGKKLKEKEKGGTGFLTSIFKKPELDDDRQRLLNDEGKKRGWADRLEKGKGKIGEAEQKAKKTLAFGRRGYRRATRRIRERYYRNKKLAEEQKGRYACDFYLMSLRNKPCLWVYYLCPFFYPYCLQALNVWRQISDLLLFFVAILVWSPCILTVELFKALMCNMWVTY